MTGSPIRLQLSRAKGFDLQKLSRETNGLAAVNVARPGSLGNPYRIGQAVSRAQAWRWGWGFSPIVLAVKCADAREAVARFFHELLWWSDASHERVRRIAGGKNVACACALDQPCHGDPILWLANSTPEAVNEIRYLIDQNIMDEADVLLEIANPCLSA